MCVLDGDLWRSEIGSRLVALVPDDKGWNDILDEHDRI